MKKGRETSNSDFKYFIENNKYYVDKTLIIEDLFATDTSQVVLLPRPRRFGKTLNMSMLHYYFDITQNNRHLFKGLDIEKSKIFEEHLNKYPTIFLSFIGIDDENWPDCFNSIKRTIIEKYGEHKYLLESDKIDDEDKTFFKGISSKKASKDDYSISIRKLCEFLYKYYGKEVIVLLDEYDTPINASFIEGFYKSSISFFRKFIINTFKANKFLIKGTITGILKVAKESIFSGANNIQDRTILNEKFSDKFGFLEGEVIDLLKYYSLEDRYKEVKEKYNGYNFSGNLIYNPWAIMNFVSDPNSDNKTTWISSGGVNSLIKGIFNNLKIESKEELLELNYGMTIKKSIETSISFNELFDESKDIVWSFLLFTGYLTYEGKEGNDFLLKIPNLEIKDFFDNLITAYLKTKIDIARNKEMLNNLVNDNIDLFEQELKEYIERVVGSNDAKTEENYYFFMLGVLKGIESNYEIKGNHNSGYGRADIMLTPHNNKHLGIVIELKYKTDLLKGAEEGLKQIEDKKYTSYLKERKVKKILGISIAFKGKEFKLLSKYF